MLRRIFYHLRSAQPALLGRWCLMDKSKNNWKIDMANVDHCGTCSTSSPPKRTKQSETAPTSPLEEKPISELKGKSPKPSL